MTLPYVMNIAALAVSPAYPCDKTVFLGTDGNGVFRTTDTSIDSVWMPISSGLFDQGILSLAVSPNYGRCDRLTDRGDRSLYAGTRTGVFRSQNGGASWELRSQGLPSDQAVQSVAISPNYASDRTVYAGFEGSLFRSTDSGASWAPFDAGLTDRSIQAFALSANYANDNTLFVGTRFSGVYRIAGKLQAAGALPGPLGRPSPQPTPLPSLRTQSSVAVEVPPSSDGHASGPVPADDIDHRRTIQATRVEGALLVILWACDASGTLCSADGSEWTTIPGVVTLKLEIKNIGTETIRNILITDDRGTPETATDDILMNGDSPTLSVGPGTATTFERRVIVNGNRGASGTDTRPFVWTVSGVCGATFTACTPAAVASDDAIVRVISTQSRASMLLEVIAGGTVAGQTYVAVPGNVPLSLNVINNGNEAVRAVQIILDAGGNDGPGCSDNPATEGVNETADDIIAGLVPSLGPGQSTAVTASVNVKPESEATTAGSTFSPIRVQACALGQAGDVAAPVPVVAGGSVLVQLVVWQSITSGSALSNLWVTSVGTSPFYANDQTIFAGTSYGGLFRSTNAATSAPTWELVNEGLDPTFTWVRAIALSPRYAFDRTIYVGTESGVFRGTESGQGGPISWVKINNGLAVSDVRAVGISPDYGRDSIVFAGTYGADVYRLKATSNEVPWEPYRRVVNGLWSWAVALTQDGVLLNGTWGRGVGRQLLSTGSDWSYSQPGIPPDAEVTALTVSPGYCSGYTAFAGTWAHGLYRSLDAGANWVATTYSTSYGPIRDVAVAPSYDRGRSVAVATWGGGVHFSHDDGVTWTAINAGLTDLKVRSVVFSPAYPGDPSLYAGTDTAGLLRYDFGVGRWTSIGGLPATVMAVALSPQFVSDGTIVAGTWGSGIYISQNRGVNWSPAPSQPNRYVRAVTFSPSFALDGTVYAGTNQGLYRSTSRGAVWSLVGTPEDPASMVDVTDIALTMTLPRTIFVSTGGRGIWQFSESNGASYQTSQLAYRAYVPAVTKGRIGSIC